MGRSLQPQGQPRSVDSLLTHTPRDRQYAMGDKGVWDLEKTHTGAYFTRILLIGFLSEIRLEKRCHLYPCLYLPCFLLNTT